MDQSRSKSELNLFTWTGCVRAAKWKKSTAFRADGIGYIHVPDTANDGNRELLQKSMYAYKNKEALIIDERYNGGGFIPVWS